jgi:C-terminal processing protease CtpA/Prc
MWPMLTVLAPLLGDGPIGSFAPPDGAEIRWAIHNGDILLDSKIMGTNPLRLTHPTPPIAVLTSTATASSGEATLVALLGLDRARTFGLPTAGLATANQGFHLADGALIMLTTAVMVDRTGHHHGPPITPDVRATQHAGADIAAATAWLANRPGC